jgi:hypothetical protein
MTTTTKIRSLGIVGVGVAALLAAALSKTSVRQAGAAAAGVGANNISGTVASYAGPEAGVWVIAETTDLPTRYMKEVVTDDRGRYLIPDLPKANYSVWARGYGLVDSPKVQIQPGKSADLKPAIASDKKIAAQSNGPASCVAARGSGRVERRRQWGRLM